MVQVDGVGHGTLVKVAVCIIGSVQIPKLIVVFSAYSSHQVIRSRLKVHLLCADFSDQMWIIILPRIMKSKTFDCYGGRGSSLCVCCKRA